jgi:hypothetical protein
MGTGREDMRLCLYHVGVPYRITWPFIFPPVRQLPFFFHIFPSLFGFLPRLHPLTTLQESPSAAQATRPRKDPNQEKPIIEKNTAPCNLVISSPLHHTCITLDQVLCRVLTCPFMRPVHELAACGLIQSYSNYTSTITLGTLAAMVLPGPGPENCSLGSRRHAWEGKQREMLLLNTLGQR